MAGMSSSVNPVSWVFHEAPVDCWRIYPEGMKALLEHTPPSHYRIMPRVFGNAWVQELLPRSIGCISETKEFDCLRVSQALSDFPFKEPMTRLRLPEKNNCLVYKKIAP
jgi:hypothetical protein